MGVFLKTRVLSNSPISVNPALALEFQAGLWVLRRAMVKYRLTNARTFTTQARALLFWQYQIPVPLTSRQGACSTHNRKHRPLGPNASRKAAGTTMLVSWPQEAPLKVHGHLDYVITRISFSFFSHMSCTMVVSWNMNPPLAAISRD